NPSNLPYSGHVFNSCNGNSSTYYNDKLQHKAVTRIKMKIPSPQPFKVGDVRNFSKDAEEVAETAELDTDGVFWRR
ncbi:hypothetical protein T265_14778, partial [Opisthorchis viverrini]